MCGGAILQVKFIILMALPEGIRSPCANPDVAYARPILVRAHRSPLVWAHVHRIC